MSKLLIIGCGHRKEPFFPCGPATRITTLDNNSDVKPDILHDLEILPYPFDDNSFDDIEAIEVLEHIGHQGDWLAFFEQFSELWRILKPDGELRATVPTGPWTWGDPGHRRVINEQTLVYLSQAQYIEQEGLTPMTDYRHWYKADFDKVYAAERQNFRFVLRAVKPSRGG